jgi:hypothetical protein
VAPDALCASDVALGTYEVHGQKKENYAIDDALPSTPSPSLPARGREPEVRNVARGREPDDKITVVVLLLRV